MVHTMTNKLFWLWVALIPAQGICASLSWERDTIQVQLPHAQESYEAAFTFRNTSREAVKIEKVEASCGCTNATASKTIFAPGETGQVLAKYSAAGQSGLKRVGVSVWIAGEAAPKELSLVVDVLAKVGAAPRLVYWRVHDKPTPKAIRLTVADGYEIEAIRHDNTLVKPAVKGAKGSREYEITLTPLKTGTPMRTKLDVVVSRGTDSVAYALYASVIE